MSMTTHWEIKNGFHIQYTTKLGCGATAFVAETIVVAGLWKRRKLCHKPLIISCTKATKNLGYEFGASRKCKKWDKLAVLRVNIVLSYIWHSKNHPLWQFRPTYSKTYIVTRLLAEYFFFTIFTDYIFVIKLKIF